MVYSPASVGVGCAHLGKITLRSLVQNTAVLKNKAAVSRVKHRSVIYEAYGEQARYLKEVNKYTFYALCPTLPFSHF